MTLKWLAVVVATVSMTLWATGNVVTFVVNGGQLPLLVNLLALISAGTAVILAVIAELHERLNNRLSALTEFLVARLNEIETRTGDRNTGFVEGYLLSHGQEATVVPFGRRGRGAAER
ncbi:hypothetical protein ACWD6L_30190 [Micromonospora profundi]|uniref:Uncharacterized protein n=1 Tax=Micromonospora profundi TaxID=1420889 RepID=A0AAJ6HY09_9ACTN|nr:MULTISPECIES: hypothetical protein [Micromonospora]KOX09130.1 hypothetical protein ADK66_13835 [Micromonospora sp. NRRL B-16802]NJC14675.1 hypothetical protein [Micromonospora profundi]WLS46219.1 hypothetical protein Q3V37_02725 [Micromonospora profundi]